MMNGVENRGGNYYTRFPFMPTELLHYVMASKYEGNVLHKAHTEDPAVS